MTERIWFALISHLGLIKYISSCFIRTFYFNSGRTPNTQHGVHVFHFCDRGDLLHIRNSSSPRGSAPLPPAASRGRQRFESGWLRNTFPDWEKNHLFSAALPHYSKEGPKPRHVSLLTECAISSQHALPLSHLYFKDPIAQTLCKCDWKRKWFHPFWKPDKIQPMPIQWPSIKGWMLLCNINVDYIYIYMWMTGSEYKRIHSTHQLARHNTTGLLNNLNNITWFEV